MRTDFKIGFVGSLAVVVLASWYFTRIDGLSSAIPITANDEILPLSARMADNAVPSSRHQPEETPVETVAPSIDDSLAVIDANSPEDVEHPSLDNVFATALTSPAESEFDNDAHTQTHPVFTPENTSADSFVVQPPSTTPVPSSGDQFETHTVRFGDTIAQLARLYYGDVSYVGVLLRANPLLTDPANIPIGTTITIPDVDDVPAEPATTSDSQTPTQSPQPAAYTHTVVKGDTLYTIARRRLKAAARWKEIYELNKATIGENPNQLPLGAALVLPR